MRTKSILQQNTSSLKYLLLLLFVPLFMFMLYSCEEEEEIEQEELIADFSASATEIAVGASVTFTDESSGEPTSWSWVFEGGTPATSTEQNPTVTFNENIAADVTLTITRESDGATHTVTKEDFIQVAPVLIADFSASATEIAVGASVTFTDESSGEPTSWSWEFEGGTPATSTEQNPTVTFNENIAADVTLTVTRESDGATHTVTKEDFIQVAPVQTLNLITNGDFEPGSESNWTIINADFNLAYHENIAVIANGYLKLDYGSDQDKGAVVVYQKIELEQGKSYKLSADFSSSGGVTSFQQFKLSIDPSQPQEGVRYNPEERGAGWENEVEMFCMIDNYQSGGLGGAPLNGTLPQVAPWAVNVDKATGVFQAKFSGETYIIIYFITSLSDGTITLDNISIEEV